MASFPSGSVEAPLPKIEVRTHTLLTPSLILLLGELNELVCNVHRTVPGTKQKQMLAMMMMMSLLLLLLLLLPSLSHATKCGTGAKLLIMFSLV